MKLRFLTILAVSACSGDPVHHLPDAPCVPSDPIVDLSGSPATYTCHAPFTTKVTVTNNTCEPLAITDVKVTAMVTNGPCSPAVASTYPGSTVGVGLTDVALDLTAGAFCCTPGACPTPFQCDETFSFAVETSAGTITKTETSHLSLDGCNEICP